MTTLRTFTWGLLATGAVTLAACSEQVVAPSAPLQSVTASLLTGSIDALDPGGTSNTVQAKAVSPGGWVLGNFNLDATTTRAKAWSPYPGYGVSTVTDYGMVFSAADEHGDVTAHVRDVGPVVYVADPVSGGVPYTVASLPLPPGAGSPGNWIAFGLNDAHLVVGSGHGDGGPVAWAPTAPGATSWFPPIALPFPDYPRGVNVVSRATGVNAAGLVVGTIVENLKRGIIYRAWHWRVELVGGVWTATSLGELPWASGSSGQAATDVNDSGVIVGYVNTSSGSSTALWYPDASGNYTQAPTVLAGDIWNTTHINRCGWTVSSMMAKGGSGDVVAWNGTQVISLPMMDGSFASRAWDINDNGIVAGTSVFRGQGKKAPTTQVATVWRDFVPPCT